MSKKGRLLFILSILCVLALGGLFFSIRVWMPFMWFVIAPAVFSFMGWVYLDRSLIFDFFTMKTTKHGINMGFLVLIAVVLLIVLNFVGARHYATYDFSSNNRNSLSDQSKKILASLEAELNVKYFYKDGAERAEENKKLFRELVKQYQDVNAKNVRINLEMVEINQQPKLVQEFGATKGTGEAFIEYKGNKNRIENYSEQDFTNALIKLTRKEKKHIYFLEGHNERSVDDEKSEVSLYGFKQMLEKNSYDVKKLNLLITLKVPEDAHVLVIAAPTQQIQSFEIRAIEEYLKQGGNLFLMLDEKNSFGLASLLKKFGLELETHYVYNVFDTPMGKVVNAQAATVGLQYSASSAITKVFTQNQMTLFRNPHSLRIVNSSPDIKIEAIVSTPKTAAALAEIDSKDYTGELRAFNLAVEVKGKLNATKEFSAVVIADADFASNILLYQNLNRDLALNVISSLTKETDLISISAKEPLASKMLVSPPEFNQFFKFTVVGLFFPLPFIFMIMSIVLWYRRRHA
ncbi:MAG: Gldg family protein [Bdellovibrionota bacterium]